MRAWASVVFVVVGIAGCPKPAPPPSSCPDVDHLCPDLVCVERKQNAQGCATCECARQACVIDDDCERRVPPQRCLVGADVCEPPPGCTDDDDDTVCPAACYGLCVAAGAVPAAEFCLSNDECGADGACRFDDRFCVFDPERGCVGYCANVCNDVETVALDPTSGQCFDFKDSCVPPGFIEGC